MRPQLPGIVPTNTGGFGKVTDAVDAFFELEIQPLQPEFEAINDWLGAEAVLWRKWRRFVPMARLISVSNPPVS